MQIKHITLTNFRNYEKLTFTPSEGLNILTGANAQGKTNLLESIFYLATGRALRTNRDLELLKSGAPFMSVEALVHRVNTVPVEVRVNYQLDAGKPAHKQAVIDSKIVELVSLLGKLNVVVFSSLDLETVRGEPAGRRQYLDTSIGMISSRYANNLSRYRKVLDQRNKILKTAKERNGQIDVLDQASFEVLSQQLTSYGAEIIHSRIHFINQLLPYAAEAHCLLSDSTEYLKLEYVCPFTSGVLLDQIKQAFDEGLLATASDELRRGTTCVGPHRDDLLISVNGMDARHYGSQGQQRTATLALKRAEYQLVTKLKGEAPVLLLDDVLSDLDEGRRERLLKMNLLGAQSIITCTEVNSLPAELLEQATIFHVQAGHIT
ncbi:MAG: DNA replication/repair protein RecF [Armatimonadota bacterium]